MKNLLPIALLGGGLLLLGGKKKRRASAAGPKPVPAFTQTDEQAHMLLKRVAAATKNSDLDPDKNPISDILLEIQLTYGVEPTDGAWNKQTYDAIVRILEDFS